MKIGNYNPGYLETAMVTEGTCDILNYDRSELTADIIQERQYGAVEVTNTDGSKSHVYEFIIIPKG